ncbi:MAG TPA: cytochrome c [Acetobacteraceae bacterium]|nr:cytochrome c [Acetobacteraceae bacterium]
MRHLPAMTAFCALMTAVCQQPLAAGETPLERGRYLVETVAFCGVCHNARTLNEQMIPGMELAGGRVMPLNELRIVLPDLPPGDIRAVVPNITPDPETGIGRWTNAQIATAIREGRRPDGSMIGPPMPIALYRGISDRDLTAIVTYLRTVPPKHNAVTQRSTYPFAIESYGPPIDHVPDPADNPVARGAYLAGPLAHCMECHTPVRSPVKRDWSRMGAGGMPFEGPWGIVVAPDITPDKKHGIGAWTDDQIRDALTRGMTPDGRHLLPPMGARAPIYSGITESDMRDLIAYLRSLPAQ